MAKVNVTINKDLTATLAAEIVKEMGKYQSSVEMKHNGKTVDIKSILGIMSLSVPKGSEIEVTAEGADESQVLEAAKNLFT